MKNKKLVVIGSLSLLFIFILSGIAGFLFIVYPPIKEKRQTEKFFEEVENFDEVKKDLIDISKADGDLTKLSEDDPATALQNFQGLDAEGAAEDMDALLKNLKESKPPKEIEDEVEELITKLENLNESFKDYSEIITYLLEVSNLFLDFNQDMQNITTNFTTIDVNDLGAAIQSYDEVIANFNKTYDEFLKNLKALSVPEDLAELQTLFEDDFTNLYVHASGIFTESRDLLVLTKEIQDAGSNVTLDQLNRSQAKATELQTKYSDIKSTFPEMKFSTFDFEEKITNNPKYKNISSDIQDINELMEEISDFKADTLN